MPDTLTSLWNQALQTAYTNPLLYRIAQQQEAAELSHVSDIEYWRGVYPKVELRATDNPGVDFRMLTMPWSVNYGNPPLVFLNVTPRKKELPKTSGWLQTAAIFAPVVAAIPVVGAVLAIALQVAAAADQAGKIKNFIGAATSITSSEFEPQYYPHEFPVLLPLDEAQAAVESPWLLPSLWHDFKNRIILAQQRMAQELAGEPSTLTLTPGLNPEVVSITGPGGTAPGQANEQWLDRLYAAFGQTTSTGEQFRELQTSLGSRVPSYGNVTDPATAGYFQKTGQAGAAGQPQPSDPTQPAHAAAASSGGVIALALAGGAALLVATHV
jgi:hypothetical protein